MSTTAAQSTVEKTKEPLFGKKERKLLVDPLNDNNPITVQVLGICSALAVTTQILPSFVITIAVIFVCGFASLFTSLLRTYIPKQVRMIVQLVIIAFLVTVVELVLKAANYEVWKQLSVFIGLIITNCIVMGRLEAFAMANKPWRSFLDGIGNGLGYGLILIIVAFIRELFGKGTLFAGTPIELTIFKASESGFMADYLNNNLFVFPPAAMFIIAVLIWIQRSRNRKLIDIS
ncbi:MAG: NADH:ubiquinone reductase (Na(+)-transporting) subunit D [Bacteroidota bacterium]